MKILIVMDPGILIPVIGYGGHERLVDMFAKEYFRLGHEIHLLTTDGSTVPGCTVHSLGKVGFPSKKKDTYKAIFTAWQFLLIHRNFFDLVHNFGRLIYLLPIMNNKVKKIMTYGREIKGSNINKLLKLPHKNIVFTGCSENLINRSGADGNWQVVYNAIDINKYTVTSNLPDDAPLIFLGRIEKIKGCHTAIEVAKATGNKLVIAGNISPLPEEKQYFEKHILPQIDGQRITYIGQVDDTQKNEWLGKCKAMLFPIEWEEPFGMVMVESMACGTPVIAFNIGSVNEVIDEGLTGIKINDKNEMINSINKINFLNRLECREKVFERFDVKVIAKKYLDLFN